MSIISVINYAGVGTYICKQNVKLRCLCIPVSLDGTSANCELPPYPGPSSFPAVVTFAEDQGLVLACGGGNLADVDREVTHAGGLKLLSVSYITANLYCICLSEHETCA